MDLISRRRSWSSRDVKSYKREVYTRDFTFHTKKFNCPIKNCNNSWLEGVVVHGSPSSSRSLLPLWSHSEPDMRVLILSRSEPVARTRTWSVKWSTNARPSLHCYTERTINQGFVSNITFCLHLIFSSLFMLRIYLF